MRIGLDFDNTLARYDHVFACEAKKENIVSKEWQGTKKQLRETLRSLERGDHLWQQLQGRVYGPMMPKAEIFPGVDQFMHRCKHRGDEVFIVSHKTEYGHYDPTKTLLRKAALKWMEGNGFFDKSKFGLNKNNVFFENSRLEKVNRIANLELDVFVDDLKEVFEENEFPDIRKVLFTSDIKQESSVITCQSWSAIANNLLGKFSDVDCKNLAEFILNEIVSKVKNIQGRGNSRIYKVVTKTNKVYALKYYPDLLLDTRNRLNTEVQSYNLLKNYHLTPKVVAYDVKLNIALFEWIEGDHLQSVHHGHIDQALNFIKKLQDIETPKFSQPASEACTSAEQLFQQIEGRLQKLETIEEHLLLDFLNKIFKPLYLDVKHWSAQKWPANNFREVLIKKKLILSPSDFGFHNSILRNNGTLCFLDFEYFGWDDPVKLIADFIWHPAMTLNNDHKKYWLDNSFLIFKYSEEMKQRFHAAWAMYGMRWVMILLNEFSKEGWEKKLHVDENLGDLREQKHREQLDKAVVICDLIKSSKMECPYV